MLVVPGANPIELDFPVQKFMHSLEVSVSTVIVKEDKEEEEVKP